MIIRNVDSIRSNGGAVDNRAIGTACLLFSAIGGGLAGAGLGSCMQLATRSITGLAAIGAGAATIIAANNTI